MEKISKKGKVVLLISVLVRILIQCGIPIYFIPNASVDDMLFVDYATNILEGEWLGAYNAHTLNKMPGFGIFLAACKFFHMPYMLALGILYSFATVLFFIVLCKFVNKRVAFICFLFVLYSPIMFDLKIAQRCYRMSVMPILVLLMIVSYFAIYLERNCGWKKLLPWSLCAGISFSIFYLTREDSIWFLSFILGASILILGKMWMEKECLKKEMAKVMGCIIIPVILCFISVQGLRVINYAYYGVYAATDFNETAFADMGKKILNIESETETQEVWVTHSVIERLYEVSPTFSEIKQELEYYYEIMDDWGTGKKDGEIEKDFIIWAIRWSAERANIYTNAKSANEFYQKVCDEIDEAFENGELEKNNKLVISNLSQPFEVSNIPQILKYLSSGFIDNIGYGSINCEIIVSGGERTALDKMESITSTNAIEGKYQLFGWIISMSDEEKVTLEIQNGTEIIPLSLETSDDVYEVFKQQGWELQNARNARFSYEIENKDLSNAYLNVYVNDRLTYTEALENISTVENESIKMHIDTNAVNYNYEGKYAEKNIKIPNAITKVYQITAYIIAIFAGIVFIAEIILNIKNACKKKKTNFASCLMKIGLLLTIFANYLTVSINFYNNADAQKAMRLYTAGSLPIWQVFVCLCICSAYKYIKSKRK